LVAIGPVVSEEKIKVYDVRRTPSDGKSSHGLWPGELKSLKGVVKILPVVFSLADHEFIWT
jgi:hypothetical protein